MTSPPLTISAEAYEALRWASHVFITHEDLVPIGEHMLFLGEWLTRDPQERGGSTIMFEQELLRLVRSVPNG